MTLLQDLILTRNTPDAADLRQLAHDGPTRRPNTFAWCGTSRIAAQFQAADRKAKGNAGWMNWAAGWLRGMNKPMITLNNYAVSGSRSDEFAPNVSLAIATGASNIVIDGPINSIAQAFAGYTPVLGPNAGIPITLANVATACLAEYKQYFKAINDAGARIVYVWERGANSFTTAQIAALNDFDRLLADYIQNGDDYRGAPTILCLDPRAKSVVTSNTTAIALKNSVDGTHDNVAAAQIIGLDFATKLSGYLREMAGHRLSRLTQAKSGVGTRSMSSNAGLTGSVAAGGTGNTGNVPTNFSTGQTGGVTAAYSIQATTADADGNTWGNEVKIVATATAAGTCSLILGLDRANIVLGDLIKGGLEIDVTAGATGLAGAAANLEWFPSTGGTAPNYDMFPSTVGVDAGGYANFVMEPEPLPITAYTGSPFTNLALRLTFSGAGAATVIARKFWAERT